MDPLGTTRRGLRRLVVRAEEDDELRRNRENQREREREDLGFTLSLLWAAAYF